MKSYSSREVIKILEENDWFLERIKGDHYIFKHKGSHKTVPLPHPVKDIKIGTLKSIQKLTGLKFK